MEELVLWGVSKISDDLTPEEDDNDTVEWEETFLFRDKEKAWAFAQKYVLELKPTFNFYHDLYYIFLNLASIPPKKTLTLKLGEPEIVLGEEKVTAYYPTIVIATGTENVKVRPEIKKEGVPYQSSLFEERTTVREIGPVYVESSPYRSETFHLEQDVEKKRKEWRAFVSVILFKKVIELWD